MQTIEEIAQDEYSELICNKRVKKKYFRRLLRTLKPYDYIYKSIKHELRYIKVVIVGLRQRLASCEKLIRQYKKCLAADDRLIELLKKEIEAKDAYISILETQGS